MIDCARANSVILINISEPFLEASLARRSFLFSRAQRFSEYFEQGILAWISKVFSALIYMNQMTVNIVPSF